MEDGNLNNSYIYNQKETVGISRTINEERRSGESKFKEPNECKKSGGIQRVNYLICVNLCDFV